MPKKLRYTGPNSLSTLLNWIKGLIDDKADKKNAVIHPESTQVGNMNQGVYIDKDGNVQRMTYTLGKSVPVDARFTDTTYKAGTNISISADNTISAFGGGGGGSYIAGDNIIIEDNVIYGYGYNFVSDEPIHIRKDKIEGGYEVSVEIDDATDENSGLMSPVDKFRLDNVLKTYTAGDNVEISERGVISAVDTIYHAGAGILMDSDNVISVAKMPIEYSAGDNIEISENNVISAIDTKYSNGNNVRLSANNEFSVTAYSFAAGNDSVNITGEPDANDIMKITIGVNEATTDIPGLMSSADKEKLNGLIKYTAGDGIYISDVTGIIESQVFVDANVGGEGNAVTDVEITSRKSGQAITAVVNLKKNATFLKSDANGTINLANGAAGTQGYSALILGNNKGAFSDGNSAGRLRIYGGTVTNKESTAYYAQIQAGNADRPLTANRTYYLPPISSNAYLLTDNQCPAYIVKHGSSGNYRYDLYNNGVVHIYGRITDSYTLTSYRAAIGAYTVANVLTNCSDIKLTAIDMCNVQSDGNNTSGVLTQYYPRSISVSNGHANVVGWASNAFAQAAETTARTLGINVDIWGRGELA